MVEQQIIAVAEEIRAIGARDAQAPITLAPGFASTHGGDAGLELPGSTAIPGEIVFVRWRISADLSAARWHGVQHAR